MKFKEPWWKIRKPLHQIGWILKSVDKETKRCINFSGLPGWIYRGFTSCNFDLCWKQNGGPDNDLRKIHGFRLLIYALTALVWNSTTRFCNATSNFDKWNLFEPCFADKTLFFSIPVISLFSLFFLVPLKLPKNALLRAYICKKNSWGRTPRPPSVTWKALCTLHTRHIMTRRITLCHPMPCENFPVIRKKKKKNLWLKPWLHVTNPDHKEYLWVYHHFNGLILKLK